MTMDPELLSSLPVKSVEQIVSELTEIIRRHRRKYVKRYTRPCPNNCVGSIIRQNRVHGCGRCGSHNPEQCFDQKAFESTATKEELVQEFAEDLRDPFVLQRDYRDVMALLWVLGQFDGEVPDEPLIASAEQRTPGGRVV